MGCREDWRKLDRINRSPRAKVTSRRHASMDYLNDPGALGHQMREAHRNYNHSLKGTMQSEDGMGILVSFASREES